MATFDDLSLLRAFVCIVESGSISAGARRIKIPQPTLSRYLRQLEEEAGAALLRRNTHCLSLTETGHRILADVRAMLALAEDAEQHLREDQAMLRGHLRLFATIDSGQFITTRLIANFLQLNPGITAELTYTNRSLHMIQEGCDAGIVAGGITDNSVIARPAGRVIRYLVASPAFLKNRPLAKDPSNIKSWPWITVSAAHFGGCKEVTLYSQQKGECRFTISPVLISEGATSLREAVRAGLGIAVLPDWLVREDLASGSLARVLPKWYANEFQMNVIYPTHRMLAARVRAFINFAVNFMTTELHPEK
jgi:DNA-binding transcriptional LysR family regulator